MKIKKAVCHQTLFDTQTFPEKQNPNHSFNGFRLQKAQKDVKKHDQLSKTNTKTPSSQSLPKDLTNTAAQLLAKILNGTMTQLKNYDNQKTKFYNASIMTPEDVVSLQIANKFVKNQGQIFSTEKIRNQITVQKRKIDEKSNQKVRSKKQNQDEQYNFKLSQKMKLHQQNIKTQISSELIQMKSNKTPNKSRNSYEKHPNSQSFTTLSSIKQKMQKYLNEQQQKMKFLRNSHKCSQNNKLLPKKPQDYKIKSQKGHQKGHQKGLISTGDHSYESSSVNQTQNARINASLSCLLRKKQSKHAFDMMKRRLNFSMVSKNLKDKDIFHTRTNSPVHIKRGKSFDSGEIKNKKLVIQPNQQIQGQDMLVLQRQLLNRLRNQPQLLNQVQRELLFEFQQFKQNQKGVFVGIHKSYAQLAKSKSKSSQENQISNVEKENLNKIQFTAEQNHLNLAQSLNECRQQPYSLYYHSPESIRREKQQQALIQSAHSVQKGSERYKDWKKETRTEQKLKLLLKYQSNPIDPLDFYHNSFLDHQYNMQSINSIIANQKNRNLNPLSSSNSVQIGYSKEKSRLGCFKNQSTDPPRATPTFFQEKIIFVNKKHKQNLQHKKLSNLLSKIEKRNSEIEKLGKIQVIEAFKYEKKNFNLKQGKINRLSISQYVQEELMIASAPVEEVKKSHNFIISSPKKQKTQNKSFSNKNSDDWSNFQPWRDSTANWGYQENNYDK